MMAESANRPLGLVVLGSTGSIGRQALDVATRYPERVRIIALAANRDDATLADQAIEHRVVDLAMADSASASRLQDRLARAGTRSGVESGDEAVVDLARHPEADIVLNALVGSAGLRATLATLEAGKVLALANKESLVVGGDLVTRAAAPGALRPVDSEHSAIFQCLEGEDPHRVARLWLTASGGPFLGKTRDELRDVRAERALAHPTWKMGPKITIDSATLMNKGLEVIEAHHLFSVAYDDIRVVVHPQSCVHSMVEFTDGSVKAHLGATDMRIPIQYAFSYPDRWDAPLDPVDFTALGSLDFGPADLETFGCLRLAFEAGREGGSAPCVLNASNEVAVAAFLGGRCAFLDIERTVEHALEALPVEYLSSLEHLEHVDERARTIAEEFLTALR